MGTLQSGNSPGSRIAAGDSVLEAAKVVDTRPVTARLTVFAKIHKEYAAADALVQKASAELREQQAKVGDADAAQDDLILALASTLPADGFPRVNPFKPLGVVSPAALCALGYAAEAEEVLRLEKALRKRANLSKPSIAAAKAAGQAARDMIASMEPIPRLEKARAAAMTRRAALEQKWETAFAGLKRGARAAEDDGAKGLFAALFDRPEPKAKSRTKKAAPRPRPPAEAKPS
jgi:hypothetical protein